MPKSISAHETSFAKIQKWINDPDSNKISESDKKIFDRLDFADTQLRRKPRKKEAAQLIAAKFNITLRQAYNDLWYAQKLFGSIHPFNKDWWRNWLIEDIVTLIESCKVTGDLKTWASAHANLVKAIGLDQKEEIPIDPEILSQHNYYTVINVDNKSIKIGLEDLIKIPLSSRKRVLDALNKPIDESEALEIMNS